MTLRESQKRIPIVQTNPKFWEIGQDSVRHALGSKRTAADLGFHFGLTGDASAFNAANSVRKVFLSVLKLFYFAWLAIPTNVISLNCASEPFAFFPSFYS